MKRFTGEVRWMLNGESAKLWIHEGRKQLGILAESMRFQGLKQLQRVTRYKDGTHILASSVFGLNTVFIYAVDEPLIGSFIEMESGLLLLPYAPSYPLEVFVGDSITQYTGSTIPGTTPPATEFLNGRTLQLETEDLPDELCYRWPVEWTPARNDTLYTSNLHKDSSLFFTAIGENTLTKPELYSGLLRLAVQAKIGANRNINELVPDGWGGQLQPHMYGMIRTADYTYFLVRINAGGGCSVARLTTSMPCVKTWLTDGVIPAAERLKFEAYLLSTAAVDTTEQDIEILDTIITATEFSSVYDGRSSTAGGWHYGYDDDARAGIVTYKEGAASSPSEYYWETTLAEVVFAFTHSEADGWTVSGYVSMIEEDTYFFNKLPQDLLWVRDESKGVTCLWRPPVGVVVNTAAEIDAPIYVFYGKDGVRRVLRYIFSYEPAINDPITDEDFPPVCGSGVSAATKRVLANAGNTSGWYIQLENGDPDTGASATGYVTTSYTDDEYYMTVAESIVDPDVVFTNGVCGALSTCQTVPLECASSQWLRAAFDVRGGSGSGYFKRLAYTSVLNSRICVIPLGDVDSVYFIDAEQGDVTQSDQAYTPNKDYLFTGLAAVTGSTDYDAHVMLQGIHNAYYYVLFGAYDNRMVGGSIVVQPIQDYRIVNTAAFYNSEGIESCTEDYDSWSTFFKIPGVLCTRPGLYATTSYGGDATYYSEPTVEVVTGSYSEVHVLDTFYRRWLGWA